MNHYLASILFCLGLIGPFFSWASHNMAGYINVRELSGNEVEFTLITYTDPSAASVDRCTADLEIWDPNAGPGSTSITTLLNIPRSNGPFGVDSLFPTTVTCSNENMGAYVFGTIKQNVYRTTYTFSGPGRYLVRYSDQARVDQIQNITNPGNQAIYFETEFVVGQAVGTNTSVKFLNHLINWGCANQPWTSNPGALDAEGDSLAWTIEPCWQYDPPVISTPIQSTGFVFPDQFGSNGPMTIDAFTGLVSWNNPVDPGWYATAYEVKEYRNGVLMARTRFEQAFLIGTCNNAPPALELNREAQVTPGDTVRIPFKFWDPDFPSDSIYLSLNNGLQGLQEPFTLNPPATLEFDPPGGIPYGSDDTIRGTLVWPTTPAMGRFRPYQVDLVLNDNYGYLDSAGTTTLTTHHVLRIFLRTPVGRPEPETAALPLEVFPNPAGAAFQVNLPSWGQWDLRLFDLTGIMVRKESIKGKSLTLETWNLPAGIYLLEVQGKDGWGRKKVQVQ